MRALLFFSIASCAAVAQSSLPPAANVKVDFMRDIQPLLAQKCLSCHGDEVQQSGLRLDLRQNAMRGGDYGPVIVPGKSAESKLIRRLVNGDGGLQMPPTGALATEEIALLRAWIDQGAEFRIEVKAEASPAPVDPKLQALITAARGSDLRTVRKMLAADVELVRARDEGGSTALHYAAGFGSIATMQLLLDKGADVNAANRRKSTPLFWAIHDEAKLRLLLARGADVNRKQADGRSPLYQAASIGNGAAIVKLLLEKGVEANVATSTGQTPLMAASRNSIESVKMLLEKAAKVNARNGAGGTALMAAAGSGNADIVKILLDKGADAKLLTKKNDSALSAAATAGVEESVRLLLEHGADINVRDERGYTALMYAAGADSMPVGAVKLLLAKGADLKAVADDETAASMAAKRGDSEVARLLGVSEDERRRGGVVPVTLRERGYAIPVAVEKAMALLEKQSHNFIRIGGCNSCHAQDLTSAAAALARARGLSAPKVIAQLPESMRGVGPERMMDLVTFGVGSVAWETFDFGMNGVPRNAYTDAIVRYTKTMQTAAGNWLSPESRRPPMSTGEHQTAALAIYTLQQYTPASDKAESQQAIARAVAWLEKSKPLGTQDRAFQILGLVWGKAGAAGIEARVKALVGTQRADGGWSQLPGMGTDAYATGQALYSLAASGVVAPADEVYQKGLRYLLRSQAEDGSWEVQTRSIWLQPYFESGFPYGHNQWISVAGTAWATMALSMAHEPQTISRR